MLNVPFRPWTRDYIKHEEAHTEGKIKSYGSRSGKMSKDYLY